MKKRKDGRYQKVITVKGVRYPFYGKTIAEINKQILEFRVKEEKGKLFKEVAEEWENEHQKEVSVATNKRYKSCVERAVNEFGDKHIKQITVGQINDYIKRFSKTYTSAKTVKMQRSVIGLIFKYAILKSYVSDNPCAYVPVPNNLKQNKRELPKDEEIEKVKNSIHCTFGLFAYLILYTGLRRGEALALQYKDIDFENKCIHVTKSVFHDGNKPVVKTPKTEAGKRDVLLLDCLAEKIPKSKSKNKYLFPNEKGELIHQSNFNRLWRKYKDESGVNISPHQLRHAFATILYEANISDKDAQELMGHSSIILTRNIYQHISAKQKSETLIKLNEYVSQKLVKSD